MIHSEINICSGYMYDVCISVPLTVPAHIGIMCLEQYYMYHI